eukprot:gene15112-biopygen12693
MPMYPDSRQERECLRQLERAGNVSISNLFVQATPGDFRALGGLLTVPGKRLERNLPSLTVFTDKESRCYKHVPVQRGQHAGTPAGDERVEDFGVGQYSHLPGVVVNNGHTGSVFHVSSITQNRWPMTGYHAALGPMAHEPGSFPRLPICDDTMPAWRVLRTCAQNEPMLQLSGRVLKCCEHCFGSVRRARVRVAVCLPVSLLGDTRTECTRYGSKKKTFAAERDVKKSTAERA